MFNPETSLDSCGKFPYMKNSPSVENLTNVKQEILSLTNLLLLPLVVCFLFGTALQELLGKRFGFNGITQINTDKVMNFIWRLHLLQICHNGGHYQEKCKHDQFNLYLLEKTVEKEANSRCDSYHPLRRSYLEMC